MFQPDTDIDFDAKELELFMSSYEHIWNGMVEPLFRELVENDTSRVSDTDSLEIFGEIVEFSAKDYFKTFPETDNRDFNLAKEGSVTCS